MSNPLRIIIASDEAGYHYKEALKADMQASADVASVEDMGVDEAAKTPYPTVAIAAG